MYVKERKNVPCAKGTESSDVMPATLRAFALFAVEKRNARPAAAPERNDKKGILVFSDADESSQTGIILRISVC